MHDYCIRFAVTETMYAVYNRLCEAFKTCTSIYAVDKHIYFKYTGRKIQYLDTRSTYN